MCLYVPKKTKKRKHIDENRFSLKGVAAFNKIYKYYCLLSVLNQMALF